MLLKGPSRVISDLLAYQARVGKVRKVGPANFAVVSSSMSRSTRWRCLHWRNEFEALRVAVASLPPLHTLTTGHTGEPGTYARHMLRIDEASLADLDDLIALESNLFNEDAAKHDTYIDLAWAERDGRAEAASDGITIGVGVQAHEWPLEKRV